MSISLITVYNIFNCVHIWTLHRLNCRSNTQHWRYANIQMQAKIPKTHTFPPRSILLTNSHTAMTQFQIRQKWGKHFPAHFASPIFPARKTSIQIQIHQMMTTTAPPRRVSAMIVVFRESIFRAGQFIYENWQLRSCGSQLCGLPPTNGFLSVWFMTVSRRSHLQPAKMLLISTSWWSVYSAVAAVKHSSKPKIDLLHALDHNLLECCLL